MVLWGWPRGRPLLVCVREIGFYGVSWGCPRIGPVRPSYGSSFFAGDAYTVGPKRRSSTGPPSRRRPSGVSTTVCPGRVTTARKSVVEGGSVAVRVALGGGRIIKK